MARFLITTWPFPGHLYPQVAVAKALRDRGHEVAFYTGRRAASTLAAQSFPHLVFERIDEERLYDVVFGQGRGSLRAWGLPRFQRMLRRWLVDTIPGQVEDLQGLISAWRPDVLITDPTVWAPILVLHERLALPVAVSSFVPACMIPGRDAPPFGLGLPPPRTLRGRLLARAVRWVTAAATRSIRDAANALRRHHRLPPIGCSVTEHAGRMPLYLVPAVPEFDYGRRDLPASVRYVGPLLWNSPGEDAPPDWLPPAGGDRPWVHVTEGTVHVDTPLVLRAAARGLGRLPVEVVMTTGSDREPASLGLAPLPSNVRVGRWVSHRELLPRCSAVVTTGGAGTVLASLSAGVPLVVVPTEWDKPENAQRVVEAGAGVRLPISRCTARGLRAAVERVLGEASFRENARRLARLFTRAGGAPRAAELIEELAGPPGSARYPAEAVRSREAGLAERGVGGTPPV